MNFSASRLSVLWKADSITLFFIFSLSLLIAATPAPASASTIVGYWRMEQDTDGSAGYSIPNEVAGNPLNGSDGAVAPPVPVNPVPQTGATNTNALGGRDAAGGNFQLNGTIPYYAALDVSSITVEFFVRTTEGGGRFAGRRAGATGVLIDDPTSLRALYSTASGSVTINGGFNFPSSNGEWTHVAFTYEQATGLAQLFVNGIVIGMNDGPDGEALTWPAGGDFVVGPDIDGFTLRGESIFDELRITDMALEPSQFLNVLNVPEPTTAVLLALGVAMCALSRRQKGTLKSARVFV